MEKRKKRNRSIGQLIVIFFVLQLVGAVFLSSGKLRSVVCAKENPELLQQAMEQYMEEQGMSRDMDLETLIELITAFPAQYDYSSEYSSAEEMVLHKAGDCLASTQAICSLAERMGFRSWSRYAAEGLGRGTGHRNAIIYDEGTGRIFLCEAGLGGKAPRLYYYEELSSFFHYRYDSRVSGYLIDQYDGGRIGTESEEGVLIFPDRIDGIPIAGIAEGFRERSNLEGVDRIFVPEDYILSKNSVEELLVERIPGLRYRTHIQKYGWGTEVNSPFVSGTTGKSLRVEAFQLDLKNTDHGQVVYRVHCQTYGWLPWTEGGGIAGTVGQSKRVEAIRIRLEGELEERFDIFYRVHVQRIGWMEWVKNGEQAGTTGRSLRIEAIQVSIRPKSAD